MTGDHLIDIEVPEETLSRWVALEERLEALGGEWGIRIQTGSECAWECEVRWTKRPNAPGPDVSLVTYRCGADPLAIAQECVVEMESLAARAA